MQAICNLLDKSEFSNLLDQKYLFTNSNFAASEKEKVYVHTNMVIGAPVDQIVSVDSVKSIKVL